MHIDNLFFPMQTVDEVRHHAAAEWSRSVECHRRNKIDKALWLQILDKIRHARRLHLEYSSCISIT